MRQALDERGDLIQARAEACLDAALADAEVWTTAHGTPPTHPREAAMWRRHATVVAAYRDRYRITTTMPLGPAATSAAQKIDEARALQAFEAASALTSKTHDGRRTLRSQSCRAGGRPAASVMEAQRSGPPGNK